MPTTTDNGQRTTDKKLTPVDFIPLREAAKLAGSKPNVLRKHRVAKWLAAGLAHKDPSGEWWVDPKVVETIQPVRSRVARSPLPFYPPAPLKPDLAARARIAQAANPKQAFEAQAEAERARFVQALDPAKAIAAQTWGLTPAATEKLLKDEAFFVYHDGETSPCGNEANLIAAIHSVLQISPIPWAILIDLARQGHRESCDSATKRRSSSIKSSPSSTPASGTLGQSDITDSTLSQGASQQRTTDHGPRTNRK